MAVSKKNLRTVNISNLKTQLDLVEKTLQRYKTKIEKNQEFKADELVNANLFVRLNGDVMSW